MMIVIMKEDGEEEDVDDGLDDSDVGDNCNSDDGVHFFFLKKGTTHVLLSVREL